MEIVQLISEAFMRAPLFFVVPIALAGFLIWHPWSERKFYHQAEDVDELESSEPESEIA